MLVDLNLAEKDVLIFGEGEELEKRVAQLIESKANLMIVSSGPTRAIRGLAESGEIKLLAKNSNPSAPVKKYCPFLVVACTGNRIFDQEVVRAARRMGSLAYAVDRPELNDINMPAVAKLGKIRVAISTGGRSPAIASLLRERIEQTISAKDIAQVEFQEKIRPKIKESFSNREVRRRVIYRLIRSRKIGRLLQSGDFRGAESEAESLMHKVSG